MGNTDYYDSFFQLHLSSISSSSHCYASNIDVDYQLALQLSKETLNAPDCNNVASASSTTDSTTTVTQNESKFDNCTRAILPTKEDNDNIQTDDNDQAYAYALQLQQQEEYKSELLARKLQKEEYERRNNNDTVNANASNSQKSCVIS